MRFKIVIKYIINFLFVLILITPIYEVFIRYENKPVNECWELRFIWEDSITLLAYTLLLLGWILNMVKQSKLLIILLIAFSVLSLIGTSLLFSIPSQDLIFLPGTGIFMILCFMILFYLIKYWDINRTETAGNKG